MTGATSESGLSVVFLSSPMIRMMSKALRTSVDPPSFGGEVSARGITTTTDATRYDSPLPIHVSSLSIGLRLATSLEALHIHVEPAVTQPKIHLLHVNSMYHG